MKSLLDTNVLSELHRVAENSNVRAAVSAIDEQDQFVSVISIGEIAAGIARLAVGKRRRELERWIGQAEHDFDDHLLPINRDIAHLWGHLTASLADRGKTLHAANGLIAATALHHGCRLLTRNVSDFEYTGLIVINPWNA